MASDYRLPQGQQMTRTLPCGGEIFCAEGGLLVREAPGFYGGALAAPCRRLAPGQGWRAHEGMTVTLEGIAASRFSIFEPEASPAAPPARAHEKSLLLWGRRLLGAA